LSAQRDEAERHLQRQVLESELLGEDYLQALESPLTSRLQRLGASLRIGVVSRLLSPLRGLREGERERGMLKLSDLLQQLPACSLCTKTQICAAAARSDSRKQWLFSAQDVYVAATGKIAATGNSTNKRNSVLPLPYIPYHHLYAWPGHA